MTTFRSMLQSLLILAVFAGPATAQGIDRNDQRSDESLIGEWIVESSKLAGKKERPNPPTARVRITKDRMLLINAGKTELELDCRVDGSKTPKQIDLAFDLDKGTGPVKMSIKGVFKVDDGRLIVCLNGDPKGERPQEFQEATQENGLMVFKLTKARTPE